MVVTAAVAASRSTSTVCRTLGRDALARFLRCFDGHLRRKDARVRCLLIDEVGRFDVFSLPRAEAPEAELPVRSVLPTELVLVVSLGVPQ